MTDLKECNKPHEEKLVSRIQPLDDDRIRTPYERDIHRILYSDAFRRLRHKTQVFFLVNNDHISTRMEHVLHVAAASCTVARMLELDEHLTRAIALGHDIGHAPFGHFGEEVLTEIAEKRKVNNERFHHEVYGLRVVDKLAQLDREGCGLGLTFAVRDGIISHCGEDLANSLVPDDPQTKDIEAIKEKNKAGNPVTPEGCIVKIVDKLVYAGRDLEDALKAKLFDEKKVEEEIPEILSILGNNNGEIVGRLVTDLIDNGKNGEIALTEEISRALKGLIKWNYSNIYKTDEVERYKKHAKVGMIHLFDQLLEDIDKTKRLSEEKDALPESDVYNVFRQFIQDVNYDESVPNAQIVLDFIAGMTDNYLIRCISEIFLPKPIT